MARNLFDFGLFFVVEIRFPGLRTHDRRGDIASHTEQHRPPFHKRSDMSAALTEPATEASFRALTPWRWRLRAKAILAFNSLYCHRHVELDDDDPLGPVLQRADGWAWGR